MDSKVRMDMSTEFLRQTFEKPMFIMFADKRVVVELEDIYLQAKKLFGFRFVKFRIKNRNFDMKGAQSLFNLNKEDFESFPINGILSSGFDIDYDEYKKKVKEYDGTIIMFLFTVFKSKQGFDKFNDWVKSLILMKVLAYEELQEVPTHMDLEEDVVTVWR